MNLHQQIRQRFLSVAVVLISALPQLAHAAGAVLPLDSAKVYRVACVGDSITYGAGARLKELESYPAQLQRMLGAQAVVGNFGVSGATLINQANKPYQKQRAFKDALAFNADLVIILLGTNDTKAKNWKYKEAFEDDYKELIHRFQTLESKPMVIIGYPVVVVGEGNFEIEEAGVLEQLPMIDRIAREVGVEIINLHSLLQGHEELIPDRVHPNEDGYHLMAKAMYERLTGRDFVGPMSEVITSRWKGFLRKDIESHGRAGLLVFPETAAPGNPWIWRTEFFGVYDTADLALLNKGWAVAYVDMRDLYGSPVALNAMDCFYAKVTADYGLASQVVLEGFSRGGLYAFNWAARHPDRVAAIYGDAPVLDFKSWPGGRGVGEGSSGNWTKCLKAYQLTEAEALAYPLNPVDNLKPLADAGIPILIVAGDADKTVPVEENVLLVEKRYKALGGTIKVILKSGIDHHPHSLEDPQPIVEFLVTKHKTKG
ncbi:GDSL-type esterase/lipase family protein [Planctomycetota bacterium]